MRKLKYDKDYLDKEFYEIFIKDGLYKKKPLRAVDKIRFFSSLDNSLKLPKDKVEKLEKKIDEQFGSNPLSENIILDFDNILSVSDRLSMIDELIQKENKIEFGIFGLVFYLSLTCFDSINQKARYKTFYEWLVWNNNQDFQTLDDHIRDLPEVNLKNEIIKLHDKYNGEYGVKNSFFRTLEVLESTDCYYELLSNIKLDKHLQQELDINGINCEFKRNWLFNFRNKFTHSTLNRRWPVNEDNFTLTLIYETNEQNFEIKISPKEIMISLLKCIKKALMIKIDKIIEEN